MNDMSRLPQSLTRFGIYLFAVSIPISFVPGEFGIAIAFAGWLLEGLLNKKWQLGSHLFLVLLSVYLVWNVVSALASPRPWHSLLAVGDNEWPAMLMLMMFWTIRSEAVLKRTVLLFLGSSALAMAYAVWQTFAGVELYRNMALTPVGSLFRNVGFYSFYLTFAAFAMTVFFVSGSLAFQLKGRQRQILSALAVLSFAAVVGTFARSIWLSLLVATPLLGFTRGKKAGAVTIASLAAVVILLLAAVPDLRTRAVSIFDPSQNETRLNLWRTSVAIWKDYPLIGVGEDNFDFFFPQYRVEGFYDTAAHPHNDYLNVLVSSGLPGLLAFLLMWGVAIRTGFAGFLSSKSPFLRGVALGGAMALVGFIVASFFQNYYGTFANCLGWWFMTGLIFASMSCIQAEESARPIDS